MYYQDTVMYIDLITRQTFNYVTSISCDNNPPIVMALDRGNVEHCVLTTEPVLGATPMLFEPKQDQSAISPNTFTSQEAGLYTNAGVTFQLNRNKIQLIIFHLLIKTGLILTML